MTQMKMKSIVVKVLITHKRYWIIKIKDLDVFKDYHFSIFLEKWSKAVHGI